MSAVEVGVENLSATAATLSFSRACWMIQSTKLGRSGPKTHGDARDQMVRARGQDAAFAFQFRFAVNADRPGLVLFRVGLRFLAIENVVGADVNQPRAFLRADFREEAGRLRR